MTNVAPPDQVLDALQQLIEARTEWDEAPEVYFLYQEWLKVTAKPLPIPTFVWATHPHPPTVLRNIAHTLALAGPPPHADTLIGAAFRVEAFAINSDSTSPRVQEAVRRHQAGGSVPRFEHIPGRVEQRFIQGVDLAGRTYVVSGDRLPDDSMARPRRDCVEPDGADLLTGNVPDALADFLRCATAPGANGART
ncbi:hypothetical protein DY218_27470 [Streptomyces triticagri]|uniref:Uncharacterized protein n=1 Tax=Streptomyces triticagri TaxID=2293568 RepID=A0A372LZ57_9ACTN|nr:hypothetical protein [Streptomyces triticagri]RFU83650.1 hypothetical protein DY218_27470 [Streptomyces triticagri]